LMKFKGKKMSGIKYRFQIVRNILSTEHTYLSSLQTLVKCYIEPLRSLAYLNEEEIGIVFSNTEEILKNNTLFLEALEKRVESWNMNQVIGDIFVNFMDALKLHAKYIEHYEANHEAKEMILSEKSKESLEVFFKIVSIMPQVEGRTLKEFQIVPFSRILSYQLYLTKMVQHTPKHHTDYAMLLEATTQISNLESLINHRRLQTLLAMSACTISGLEELPPNKDRIFLVKCHVTAILEGSKTTDCLAHVFTDCIVFTKDQDKLHHHIMINNNVKVERHNKLTIFGTGYKNVIQIEDVYLIFSSAPKMIDFFNYIDIALKQQQNSN